VTNIDNYNIVISKDSLITPGSW